MKFSIISPTYNEVQNIDRLVTELEQSLAGIDYEIIIADDDSPDLTWAKAREVSERNPRVRCLRRMSERGLGHAVIDGFRHATGDFVACIDADLQHDPAILPTMMRELESGADLVVGSRYVSGGGTGNWNLLRRFESIVATKMAQILIGIKLRDPMSGYFGLRRVDFDRVQSALNGEGFKILLEVVAQLRPKRVAEIPFTFRTRKAGESKLSGKVVFAYLRQLWRLSFLGRLLPLEFVKFAIVGGTGVIVNVAAFALLIRMTMLRDWRASVMASFLATLNNYVLNNLWTFRDRSHTGMTFVRRYLTYLLMALIGLGVTTATFVAVQHLIAHVLDISSEEIGSGWLIVAQLTGIALGMVSNYLLNRRVTWPGSRSQPLRKGA